LVISEKAALKIQGAIIEELNNASVDERTESMVFCLQKLKPEHRQMMRLKYFDNVQVEQIAKRLKKSFSSTQSQILRLRLKLRKCIEGRANYGKS
jgi:RNA polymerase sigma-70 factor (ECF subfamily)